MRYLTISMYVSFIVIQIGCANKIDCSMYTKDIIPKNPDEALMHLDCSTSAAFKNKFKNLEESKAITMAHFGLGRRIRNGWHLWDAENDLYNYFKAKSILNPEDISSILLRSFHRKLNNLEVDFDKQIEHYMVSYEEANAKRINRNKQEQRYINSFQIGDYVKIVMSTGYKDDRGLIGYSQGIIQEILLITAL